MARVANFLICAGVAGALLATSHLPAEAAPAAHSADSFQGAAAEGHQPASLARAAGEEQTVRGADGGLKEETAASLDSSRQSPLAVRRQLDAPAAGVVELKFGDLFQSPVGPRGLEASKKLRRLDGKRVRIVGFMVQQAVPIAGGFLLSPLPVAASDEDEALADDIPSSAIFVSLPHGASARVPSLPGLLEINGVVRLGQHEIPDAERVAAVRIELDAEPERALLELARNAPAPAQSH